MHYIDFSHIIRSLDGLLTLSVMYYTPNAIHNTLCSVHYTLRTICYTQYTCTIHNILNYNLSYVFNLNNGRENVLSFLQDVYDMAPVYAGLAIY